MRLPTPEDMRALMATQPAELPAGERIRRAAPLYIAAWGDQLDTELARWRIIATTPVLRTRAAEFERTTAEMVTEALPGEDGRALTPTDSIVANAYLSAYTGALLAWADCNGERKLTELVDEAFDALANL